VAALQVSLSAGSRASLLARQSTLATVYGQGRVCYPFFQQDRVGYPTFKRCRLRFVSTPIASQLTGLSTDKLREWTSRRALIPADQRPKRKGSPAKFSWQTILVLRVAVLLRNEFSLELQAHKAAFAELRRLLRSQSFIALWGKRLALGPGRTWVFLDAADAVPVTDALTIILDPHLAVLRDGFALPSASEDRQLDLFSLPSIHGKQCPKLLPLPDRRAS